MALVQRGTARAWVEPCATACESAGPALRKAAARTAKRMHMLTVSDLDRRLASIVRENMGDVLRLEGPAPIAGDANGRRYACEAVREPSGSRQTHIKEESKNRSEIKKSGDRALVCRLKPVAGRPILFRFCSIQSACDFTSTRRKAAFP
jgi:hypothetical protein